MGFFSKSTDKNGENDKWKDKYLNLLDTQEISEKVQKQKQELLCKTIVRLSIAASGVDPQLEPYLQNIRNHIKNGIDSHQLTADLENFTKALNGINDVPSNGQHNDKAISLLFDFLLQHYVTERQQQALNQLKKSCQPFDDPKHLYADIIDIIDDEQTDNLSTEQTHQNSLAFKQLIEPSFVSTQLLDLLERLEIPDSLYRKAQLLKQQLVMCDSTELFEATMQDVISLVIDINVSSKPKQQEIEKFLSHITDQLTDLGLAITDSSIALMDASLSSSNLDQSVSEQISDLKNRSVNATQLEPLKEVISSHIAQITKEIQEHKQKEANQREKYQHQLDELSQKIKTMESETGELKSKLITANTFAQRDVLTDLPNRLAYDERLCVEIARWQRYHTPLCLIIWDIDFFKNVNDQFGHQAGDKVLVHLAGLLSKNIRKADFIARFGGEEFIMLLPHTKKQSALKVADKLRNLIEQSHLYINDIPISTTISCGITQFISGDTHETAFARADRTLYRAKELGRNQCCIG